MLGESKISIWFMLGGGKFDWNFGWMGCKNLWDIGYFYAWCSVQFWSFGLGLRGENVEGVPISRWAVLIIFFNGYSRIWSCDVYFMMFTLSPLELYANWFLPYMESKVSNPMAGTDFTGVNGTHGFCSLIDDGCGGG